jgi:hypothetical protein
MKKIIFIFLLSHLFSCTTEKLIDKISITGIVSNSNQIPIDSVKVILEETCFMCMGSLPIETKLTNMTGGFSFELTPKSDKSYHVNFEKKGFSIKTSHSIDLKKDNQVFNVIMDSIPTN